jgi:mono/diheme cytochrome c family protein
MSVLKNSSRRLLLVVLTLAPLAAACRQDMHNQPKYQPYEHSSFFLDQRAARPVVEGTVARGHLNADRWFYEGRGPANETVAELPSPLTAATLQRGHERFDIYCSPCHDRTGSGNGMIVQRGYIKPTSFHDDRLRNAPVGHFFNAMTNGFGVMPSYAVQIPPADRWAIVAYVRALQLSQNATLADVPPDARGELDRPPEEQVAGAATSHGGGHE